MMYLLLANLYLCVFYACYHFFLRKQTFFRWNRIYLLGGLLFAFTLPLVEYKDFDAHYAVDYQHYLPTIQVDEPVMVQGTAEALKPASPDILRLALIYGYMGGCIIAFCLFAFRLANTLRMLGNRVAGEAYSFFSFIRIDHTSADHEKISQHEQVHAREWHSLDIILIQVAKIFNWFNPVVYLYERAIKLQHEYIADGETAAQDQMGYAELLVSRAIGISGPVLTNPFSNKRILKSRVAMLLRDKSPRKSLLWYTVLIPTVVAMAIFSIACNQGGNRNQHGEAVEADANGADATVFKENLAKNVVYTAEALGHGRQGFLAVTYEKTGDDITDIRFLNEFGFGQEAAVTRALQQEHVASTAPAGKHMVLINFRIQGVEDEGNDFPPPIPMSPDYGQLGEIVIVGYRNEAPPPPPVEPPPADQVRRLEMNSEPVDTTSNTLTMLPQRQPDTSPSKVVIITKEDAERRTTGVADERHDHLFESVEIPPEPPGGLRSFMEFVGKNYEYPHKAVEMGVKGVVQVSFVVESDGSLTDIKVVRDLDYGTGEAAIRVLQSSSNWSPGIQNGRPVRVAYTLPIRLNLQS